MKLGGLLRGKPARQPRRRQTSSRWLREVAKEDWAKKMVEDQAKTNPVIMAEIIFESTGIRVNPTDIRVPTLDEAIELAVMPEVLKELTSDKEFLAELVEYYENRLCDKIGWHPRKGDGRGGAGENHANPYGTDLANPLAVIDWVEQLRARFKSRSTLETVLNSPALVELIKSLGPLVLGGRNGQQQASATSPALVQVDIDGQVVEMTPAAFEALKKRLARLADKRNDVAALQANNSSELPPAEQITTTDTAPASPEGIPDALQPGSSVPESVARAGAPPAELSEVLRADFVRLARKLFARVDTRSPQEYARYLQNPAGKGSADAKLVLRFLRSGATCEGILHKVRPYKRYDDLRPYVEKLEHKRDYISALIRAIDAADHNSVTGSGHEPPPP